MAAKAEPLARGSEVLQMEGRPRSHSEGAIFQNSYDHTIPYLEYGGKNGAELALDLLGAREAPFKPTGGLRLPAWVGSSMAYPRVPAALGGETKHEPSDAARRSVLSYGMELETVLRGVEEVISLGASIDHVPAVYDDGVHTMDSFPLIIDELVKEKVVPAEYANLPATEIAKIFHINPRQSPKVRAQEHTISYTLNSENRSIIEYASLQQVVKVFSSDAQDNTAIQRLILAHEQFVDSRSMFSQFTEFFTLHQSSSAPDQIIQARILNVLKRWVEMSWPRMKQAGIEPMMSAFMSSLGNSKFRLILEKAIQQAEVVGDLTLDPHPPGSPSILKPKKSKLKKGETWSLTDFDSLEIARQLTLIDFEMLQQISIEEMLKAQWVEGTAPTLFAASKRVNDLTYWLALQIVSVQALKKRVKMITHIIKIAKHLLALNSFNSFMAVYLAFNLASTARLTSTWKNVPTKPFQLWKRLSRVMSPLNNFGAYREQVSLVTPPMVLCQEVLLKDLLFEEEGRPDFVEEGILDMTKMDEIGRLIDQFRQCRAKPYALQPLSVLMEYLKDIPSWDSAEAAAQKLDDLSRAVEPASINFPAGLGSDPASRVKSLGTLPTWKRDLEFSERLQYSNPKPSPRGAISEEIEPVSPRAAAILTPTSAKLKTHNNAPPSPSKSKSKSRFRKTSIVITRDEASTSSPGNTASEIDSPSTSTES